MTSGEMLKKLGLSENNGGKNNKKLKDQTLNYLKEGKGKLVLLENRIMTGKNGQKLQAGIELSKKKLKSAKQTFDKFEKQTEQYIEKNPKKAVAIAVAAGALAASLWSALKSKPVPPKKVKK